MSKINNREHTRYDFKPLMWVKAVRLNQKIQDFKMYQLIDISQGGISFKVHDSAEFKRNDEFFLLEIEDKVLESPIRAKVKYVQTLDEFGVDFKVGVEFISKVN